MDIKEQIVQELTRNFLGFERDPNYTYENYEYIKKVAEAILKLIEDRMLTKDEAEKMIKWMDDYASECDESPPSWVYAVYEKFKKQIGEQI